MRPTTLKTLVLAGIAGALAMLNVVDQGSSRRLTAQLPMLPALPRDRIQRIELSQATSKVVLERSEDEVGEVMLGRDLGRWKITAPIDADADQAAVAAMIAAFRKEVPIDVRVDQGNLDEYGLEPGRGLVVELFGDTTDPTVSFTLGNDAPGGTSFLRLSGSEAVYRARLGGRHRFDRAPGEWRNRVLLDFDREEASGLAFTVGDRRVVLVRSPTGEMDEAGEPVLGDWNLDPDPGWAVDQLMVDALVQRLGRLRAGAILGPELDGGFDPPEATIEVALLDGQRKVLEVGTRRFETAAFLRVDSDPTVFRAARSPLAQALLPPTDFRDKMMFRFRRGDVDTFSYEEGRTNILLQQDHSSALWNVIQPANVDVDMKLVFFAINTLAELRGHEVSTLSAAEAGLETPSARFVLHFVDGHDESLEIGIETKDARGRPCWTARVGGQRQVFLLRSVTVEKLRQGFGRM